MFTRNMHVVVVGFESLAFEDPDEAGAFAAMACKAARVENAYSNKEVDYIGDPSKENRPAVYMQQTVGFKTEEESNVPETAEIGTGEDDDIPF